MDIEKSTPERKFVFRHTEADPESKTERNGKTEKETNGERTR